jgi:hypothetical protein
VGPPKRRHHPPRRPTLPQIGCNSRSKSGVPPVPQPRRPLSPPIPRRAARRSRIPPPNPISHTQTPLPPPVPVAPLAIHRRQGLVVTWFPAGAAGYLGAVRPPWRRRRWLVVARPPTRRRPELVVARSPAASGGEVATAAGKAFDLDGHHSPPPRALPRLFGGTASRPPPGTGLHAPPGTSRPLCNFLVLCAPAFLQGRRC